MRCLALLLATLGLAACSPAPKVVHPALWQVDGPKGERAWLFGTVHALAEPVDYHGPVFDKAFAQADRLMLEVSDLTTFSSRDAFRALAIRPGQPPLAERAGKDMQPEIDCLLQVGHMDDKRLQAYETWGAALLLASYAQPHMDPDNGIDRQLIAEAGTKPLAELEGARAQYAIFDALPEDKQRLLLRSVLKDAYTAEKQAQALAQAWSKGDITPIERSTKEGMLADPVLREALYTGRNRDWAAKLRETMAKGSHPLVAVGAAHLAGADSLPAMLAAQGFKITRLQ